MSAESLKFNNKLLQSGVASFYWDILGTYYVLHVRTPKDDDDVGWESRVFVWSGLVFASSVAVDVVVLFGVLSFLLPTAFDVLRSPFLPATVGLLPYLVIR